MWQYSDRDFDNDILYHQFPHQGLSGGWSQEGMLPHFLFILILWLN